MEAVKLLKVHLRLLPFRLLPRPDLTSSSQKHFFVKTPILVCTFTNTAVDNLVDSFSTSDVNPLRVGFAARVPQHLHQYTLDARIERHARKGELDGLAKAIVATEKRVETIERSLETAKKRGKGDVAGLSRRKGASNPAFSGERFADLLALLKVTLLVSSAGCAGRNGMLSGRS